MSDPGLLDVNLDMHDGEADAAMRELDEMNGGGLGGDGGDDGAADPLAFRDLASPHSSGIGGFGSDAMARADQDDAETDSLLSAGGDPELGGAGGGSSDAAAPGGPCSLSFYQQYFDVNTAQVAGRLVRAVDPRSASFFVDGDRKPDLYGPFWISTTLVFLMAATGNFARYLTSNELTVQNDFTKVTVAASLLYSAVTVVPLIVWFFLKRVGQDRALTEVVCLYGYSLFVFVPACVICVVPFDWLRWLVTAAACVSSTRFLLRNVWNYFALEAESRSQGYLLLGLMVAFQLAISFMLKVYFFETTGDAGDDAAAAAAPPGA